MSVAKQLEVLRAFVIASNDGATSASNSAVAKIVDMHLNNAYVANNFMATVGLLVKQDGGHVPCQEVISFNRAYAFDPDRAACKLAPVLRASWFGQTVLPLIQLRPRPEAEILGELAAQSGADAKSQLVKLLDYLEQAGLIIREGGTVKLGDQATGVQRPAQEVSPLPAADAPRPAVAQTPQPSTAGGVGDPMGAIRFNIDISVTMQEVSGWDPARITAFFTGLAQVIAAKGKG